MAALPRARHGDPAHRAGDALAGLSPDEALRRLSRLPGVVRLHDGATGRVLVTAAPTGTVVVGAPDDPFEAIASLGRPRGVVRGDPGWVGMLTYEAGRAIERLPGRIPEGTSLPRLHLGRYPAGLWWTPGGGARMMGDRAHGLRLLDAATTPLSTAERAALAGHGEGPPIPDLDAAAHRRAAGRIAAAIAAGDAYQVNLTTTLRGRWRGHPVAFFERLVGEVPPPWAGYLDTGEAVIASASPELLVSLDAASSRVASAPIKGTAARGDGPGEDDRRAAALEASEKDRAEHVMIVDLVRNDLGRVCVPGTVRTRRLMAPLFLPGLIHLVTEVEGRLDARQGVADLLRAVFPGGSITGAPKVSAMHLVDALEAAPRGVYCGALGRFSPAGDVALALPIRTATLVPEGGGSWAVGYGAGGGLVADSDPAAEASELMLKARRFCEALDG